MPISINPRDIGLKFARTTKPKKRRVLNPNDAKTEKPLQEACEAWLEARGIVYLHIPAYLLSAGFNRPGFSGSAIAGAMMNAAKDVRGFPDLCIFHPDALHYIAVELKSRTGTTTKHQNEWLHALGGLVIRNFDEFVMIIEGWLKQPEPNKE